MDLSPKIVIPPPTPQEVVDFVASESKKYGVNVQKSEWIVSHESMDGRDMVGDDGNSRGYWMISSIYHPEVSTACADNLQCSTDWSLEQIATGHIDEWSTYRFCREWYKDCPF